MNEYMDVFEIMDEMRDILDLIAFGEQNEEDVQRLEELDIEFNDKIAYFVAKMKNLETRREGVKTHRKILEDKEKSLAAQIERLDKFVYFLLQSANVKSAGNDVHAAQRVKKRPIINVVDEDAVPEEFVKIVTERKINKNDLYNWFKETGEIVPGTEVKTNEEYVKTS